MSIGIGIIIFFVSFVALFAQFFIYMALGVSLGLAGAHIGGLAWLFIGLMILTGVIGVLAPASAIIQQSTKKNDLGNRIMVIGIIITILGYILLTSLGGVFGGGKLKESKIPTPLKIEQEQQQQTKAPEIKATILSKKFVEADYMNGIVDDYIGLKVEFINNTEKDMKGFKGSFGLFDIFGEKIQDVNVSYDEGIKANETKTWNGTLKYNPFIDSHVKLRTTDLENLKYEWNIEKIIYSE